MDEVLTRILNWIEILAPVGILVVAVTLPTLVVTWWLEFLARLFDNRD